MNRHLLAALAVFVAIVGVGVAAHDRFPFSAGSADRFPFSAPSADHSPSSAASADRLLGAFGGQDKQQPTFRTGVIAVPIEVRVLDENRRPITDLKAGDFTILEDGVPQTIAHFAVQVLEPGTPGRDLRARPAAQSPEPTPQNHRIFLLLLGNGALGDPRRHPEDLNALVRFVRGLLPQDQVALVAYTRATDFTTDHERVARILEGFGGSEDAGRARLGLVGRAAPVDLPSVFTPPAALDRSPDIKAELGLAEYVKAGGSGLSELDSLFYGIRYLRFVEGEKHLVLVTARGPSPDWDQLVRLNRAANDARVAIDPIQTGERMINMMGSEFGSGMDSYYDLRNVASATGGQSSLLGKTDEALSRIDAATRVSYLLAYYSSNPALDAKYRRVTVRVNRKGVRLLYRRGYSARANVETFDRRRVLADSHVDAAGYSLAPIRDIAMTVTPAFTKAEKGRGGELAVTLVVDASRWGWSLAEDGRHTAQVDVSVYAGDWWGKVLGSERKLLNIALTDESYDRVLKEGFARTARVVVPKGKVELVKVVVYDYESMLVGSTVVKVK